MGIEQAVDAGVPVRHLITVEEFLILDREGAFDRHTRLELLEGEIFEMSPVHRPHAGMLADLVTEFTLALRAITSDLRVYSPISARLDDHSLPEPDVVVATVEEDEFVSSSSIRIAIEISDSSLRFDLGKKVKLYARTAVPEYWVVDLKNRKVIRMWNPAGTAYASRDEFMIGETIPSATIPEIIVDTARLA